MKDIKEPFIILLVLFVLLGLAYGSPKKARLNNSGDSQNTSSISENKKKAEGHSPYSGKISMSNISGLYGDDPNQEYIYISSNLDEKETAKITGWYLKSEITGYFVIIGKAALLPFPSTKTESDIFLQNGDRVYLTKGFSPIGISFRTNRCIGYFEENRTFVPSLSLDCPRPEKEKLPQFSSDFDRNDECLNIIERLPRCTTVNSQFIRNLPDTVSSACKTYITTQINYNSCVASHFNDTDFADDEYRVYLNKFGPLWRKTHDKINLYDQNNLVVDTVSY